MTVAKIKNILGEKRHEKIWQKNRINYFERLVKEDAKFAENVSQNFVGGECSAGDGTEMIDTFAEIH